MATVVTDETRAEQGRLGHVAVVESSVDAIIFAAGQKVEIHFEGGKISRTAAPDVTRCLLRVLQEIDRVQTTLSNHDSRPCTVGGYRQLNTISFIVVDRPILSEAASI